MSNTKPTTEPNPNWFEPQPNQTEYTQGYFAGRIAERAKIVDMLTFDYALMAPFHPAIGEQIMDILKRVDPEAHQALQTKVDKIKAARNA